MYGILIDATKKDAIVAAMAATGLAHPEPELHHSAFIIREITGPLLTAAVEAGAQHIHRSDCALHSGPAWKPEACSCGVNPGQVPTPDYCEWDFEIVDGVLVPVSEEVWNSRYP